MNYQSANCLGTWKLMALNLKKIKAKWILLGIRCTDLQKQLYQSIVGAGWGLFMHFFKERKYDPLLLRNVYGILF